MGSSDQPNQMVVGAVFAAGVLTITGDLFCNGGVATSLADDASAVTTITTPEAGHSHWVTVITPNSAIASAGNTVGNGIENPAAPFA